jgi:hypothetical protein
MNSLLGRLRRQRIDGRSDDETMQEAANVIEALEAQIDRYDAEAARLRAALQAVVDAGDTDDSAKKMYQAARTALSPGTTQEGT